MGWDEAKFFEASIGYFFKALKGFNDLEFERYKIGWEQTRMVCFYSVITHTKSIKKPIDLFRFDWDKENIITKDEFLNKNKNLIPLWNKLAQA